MRAATCVRQALTRHADAVELRLGSTTALQGVIATVMLPNGAKVAAGSVTLDGRPAQARSLLLTWFDEVSR